MKQLTCIVCPRGCQLNIDDNNVKSIVSLYLKKDVLITNVYGKPIYPKTLNQKLYIKI